MQCSARTLCSKREFAHVWCCWLHTMCCWFDWYSSACPKGEKDWFNEGNMASCNAARLLTYHLLLWLWSPCFLSARIPFYLTLHVDIYTSFLTCRFYCLFMCGGGLCSFFDIPGCWTLRTQIDACLYSNMFINGISYGKWQVHHLKINFFKQNQSLTFY